MAAPRYIFTVTPGRSGQASLTDLVARCCPGVCAAFEEPQARTVLPGFAGDLERRFRRRFVETNELLGRGDVLRAFAAGDAVALRRYARRRLEWIDRYRRDAAVYFDISKYFIRGLHRPLAEMVRPQLVFLIRDPIFNMRSFLNRSKNFYLDNNRPGDAANEWPMQQDGPPAALYFWAWLEGYLRGQRLIEDLGLAPARIIHTNDLTDAGRMTEHFRALDLPVGPVEVAPAMNTNEQQGRGRTAVSAEDLVAFERWRDSVPPAILARFEYLQSYDPRARHAA